MADPAPADTERLNMALSPRARTALAALRLRHELTRTQIANRALIRDALLDEHLAETDEAGRAVYELVLRNRQTGIETLILFA